MTDEIPDDVVERARDAYRKVVNTDRSGPADWWRAALRVAVEWEQRELKAHLETMHFSPDEPGWVEGYNEALDRVLAFLRARTRKD